MTKEQLIKCENHINKITPTKSILTTHYCFTQGTNNFGYYSLVKGEIELLQNLKMAIILFMQ